MTAPLPLAAGAAPVVAVVRAPDPGGAVAAAEALVRGGVPAVEITMTTPDAAAVIAELRRRGLGRDGDGGAAIGAGTLRSPAEVEAVVAAGAAFLVSPGLDDAVAAAMRDSGLPALPGVYTAGEVMRARRLGFAAVKLFPASAGGIGLLRALREPFPDVAFVPTGGVTPANAREWLDAGAAALGAGGAICPAEAIAAGRFDEIERRAAALVSAAAAAR